MKLKLLAGLILSLGCISAADDASNYQTYGGVRANADPTILAHFDRAQRRCEPEANSWGRGSPNEYSTLHILAMRACLSRYDFFDRGAFAYPPAGVWYKHVLDR